MRDKPKRNVMKQLFKNNDKLSGNEVSLIFKRAIGNSCSINDIQMIDTGCAKHTYLILTNNPSAKFIFQIWKDPLSNLTPNESKESDVLWQHGLEDLETNINYLTSIELNVPKLIYSDYGKRVFEYDHAIVEYIDGEPLASINLQPERFDVKVIHENIAKSLGKLHAIKRNYPGRIREKRSGIANCLEISSEVAQQDMNIGVRYNKMLSENKTRIIEALHHLQSRCALRQTYNLVHFELGGDHILVTENNDIYYIDCENVRFFDVECESCMFDLPMLNLNDIHFNRVYGKYADSSFDKWRITFYRICKFVSWIGFFAEAIEKKEGDVERFRMYMRNTEDWLNNSLEKVQI